MDRHDCLRRAEIELKKHFETWDEDITREHLIEFTAVLLDSAYGTERRQEGLISPSSDSWIPESYFRTYINPRLSRVQKTIDKKPALLRFPSNAYLREVFEPFGLSP